MIPCLISTSYRNLIWVWSTEPDDHSEIGKKAGVSGGGGGAGGGAGQDTAAMQ